MEYNVSLIGCCSMSLISDVCYRCRGLMWKPFANRDDSDAKSLSVAQEQTSCGIGYGKVCTETRRTSNSHKERLSSQRKFGQACLGLKRWSRTTHFHFSHWFFLLVVTCKRPSLFQLCQRGKLPFYLLYCEDTSKSCACSLMTTSCSLLW